MRLNLVPISGTHGCGKSTMISMLSSNNWKVDNFQVSRYVQKEIYAVASLSEILTNPFSVMAFQELILREKYENDIKLMMNKRTDDLPNALTDIIFTERSFADIAAYATLWLTRFGQHQIYLNWLKNYRAICAIYQKRLYGHNIFLSAIEFFEDDPRRADKNDRELYNTLLLEFFNENHISLVNVPNGTPEQRYEGLVKQLHSIYG